MMKAAFFTLSVYLMAWSWGEAQVEIRSGEHSGFTRLVMYFDEAKIWQLGRIENGYGLRIDGAEQEFNLTEVFSFIPRSRILDIKVVPGGLNILSSCECHANAYNFRPGVVVLDIKTGSAPESSRFEASLEVKTIDAGKVPKLNLPSLTSLMTDAQPDKGDRTIELDERDSKSEALDGRWKNFDIANRHSHLERRLAERLGRALSEQLLTQNPSFTDQLLHNDFVAAVPDVVVENTESETPIENINHPHQALDNLQNVSIRSALDPRGEAREDISFGHCLGENYFSFESLKSDENVLHGLSVAREAFLDDLVSPSQKAVQMLVKSYLALGFGAEARQLLRMYSDDSLQASIHNSLASLVDRPEMGVAGDLRSQVDCNTDAALWALLAHGTDRPTGNVNEQAIVRTVSALPLHLRRQMVPTVSERLRRLGYEGSAAAVRETVLRAEEVQNTRLDLEVLQAEGEKKPESARNAQTDVLIVAAKPTSPVSELATASLLDELEEAGRFAPDSLLLQVASEIHTTRGSEHGQRLLNAYMTALGRRGLAQPAIDILSRLARSRFSGSYDLPNAADLFLQSLHNDAASGAFAIGAVAFEKGSGLNQVSTRVRNQVAARLDQLNLAEQANVYRPRNVLAATSELPFGAVGIAGRTTETLENRLPVIDQEEGDLKTRLSGAPGQLAWLLGEWNEAEQLLPDGARKRMASRMLDGQEPVDQSSVTANETNVSGQVTLSQTRAVLSRAADLRRDLVELGIMPEG